VLDDAVDLVELLAWRTVSGIEEGVRHANGIAGPRNGNAHVDRRRPAVQRGDVHVGCRASATSAHGAERLLVELERATAVVHAQLGTMVWTLGIRIYCPPPRPPRPAGSGVRVRIARGSSVCAI